MSFSACRVQTVCGFLLLVCPSLARADIVFNNFGAGDAFSDGGRLIQGEDVGTIGDVDQAVSFIVGPSSYYLTQLSLGIFVSSSPSDGTGPLDVVVAADDAGLPGTALRTFSLDVTDTGKQIVTAVEGGLLQLDANTPYWIIADGKDTFDGSWQFNSMGDLGNTAGRSDGATWSLRVDDDRMALRVEGRLVPEPNFTLILAGGLLALAARGRRRSSRVS
jgi:hypothetical protein